MTASRSPLSKTFRIDLGFMQLHSCLRLHDMASVVDAPPPPPAGGAIATMAPVVDSLPTSPIRGEPSQLWPPWLIHCPLLR